jgi:D-arabinose 5-phosphate isomerase GutQ
LPAAAVPQCSTHSTLLPDDTTLTSLFHARVFIFLNAECFTIDAKASCQKKKKKKK